MRSRPVSAPTSSRKGRGGLGAQYGSPRSGPAVASRSAAVSRTEIVTACVHDQAVHDVAGVGAKRISSTGWLEAHKAAARRGNSYRAAAVARVSHWYDPGRYRRSPHRRSTLPGVRFTSHGFRAGPNASGSVVAVRPNSGVLVLPHADQGPLGFAGSRSRCRTARCSRPAERSPSDVGTPAVRCSKILEQERDARERSVTRGLAGSLTGDLRTSV